jgi:hypothetical protein
MFAGHVIIGGWVSFTCTVKLHIASGGMPLVAVQLIVVMPTLNVAGDVTTVFVSVLMHVTVDAGMPVAVTVNETDAEHWSGAASTTIGLAGQFIVGATPIWIVTSACDDGHGALEIVHRRVIRPLPAVWVHVALGVDAFGLNVPVAPGVTIDHMPVPEVGVLPPSPAVVPPGTIV